MNKHNIDVTNAVVYLLQIFSMFVHLLYSIGTFQLENQELLVSLENDSSVFSITS